MHVSGLVFPAYLRGRVFQLPASPAGRAPSNDGEFDPLLSPHDYINGADEAPVSNTNDGTNISNRPFISSSISSSTFGFDIVEEDDIIYGDGVNIAARLEGLAEGGGICISGTAYDQQRLNLNWVMNI